MNPHITPRSYPQRPLPGGGGGGGPAPALGGRGGPSGIPSSQPQGRPIPQQVQTNEEYDSIPEDDREHIDEVFDLMDMKKKGFLNSYEFRHSLAALGFDVPKPEYCAFLVQFGSPSPEWLESLSREQDPEDCPVNRRIMHMDQFRLCAARLIFNRDPREEAAKVFRMFDYDGDGIISFEDMRRLAADIKDERTMTDEEIGTMIEHLDHDGKGGVNLEEFVQMMEEAG